MEHWELAAAIRRLELMRKIRVRKALAENDQHPGQTPLMHYIMDHDGCSQREVAEELAITPASVATSLKRLEKKGWIIRKMDDHDCRKNTLSLTEQGRDVLLKGETVFEQLDEQMLQGISEEELILYKKLCDRMFENLADDSTRDLNLIRLQRAAEDTEKIEKEE